jgi:hypothetical protein
MGYRHYGVSTGGLPVEYIKRFLASFSIPVFIETGTAGGESVRAASSLFRECHTIEVVPGRGAGEYPDNVKLYEGNSPALLTPIVNKFKTEYVFFWLDAHWSEPHESDLDVVECPLLEEIAAIGHHKRAVIMIDDARLFLAPPKWPCDYTRWPRFSAVFNTLQGKFPYHFISVIDDYIVCIPDEMKDIIRVEWWERQDERYPTEEIKDRMATKRAYDNLMRYIG